MIDFPAKTLFFGCGNMGGAILRGWINKGVAGRYFHVISPSKRAMPQGVHVYASAADFGDIADMLIIGIKPQMLDNLAEDIRSVISEKTIIISILAGIELVDLQNHFPQNSIVRMMPNLAIEFGKSPIGLFGGDISATHKQFIDTILAPLGMVEWGDNDEHINIVTAMAGSGPAYLYRFIDALALAAVDLGMEEKQAMRLATMMVDGASDLASLSTDSPSELAAKVTSKAGTTAAGLNVLDNEGALEHLVKNTVKAARDRGVELAQLSKKNID